MRLLAALEDGIGLIPRLPLLALCVAPAIELSADASGAFRYAAWMMRMTEDHAHPDET